MKRYRYWYSEKQNQYISHNCGGDEWEVLIDGEWIRYTQLDSPPNSKCYWEDAILVAESRKPLPIRANGIMQSDLENLL